MIWPSSSSFGAEHRRAAMLVNTLLAAEAMILKAV
jgi:hypothetical protein